MKKLNKLKVIEGMVWCGKHQSWHPVEEFHPCNRSKNGYRSSCKEVDRARCLERNTKLRQDGFWTVYELPEGYIGQTSQLELRMGDHKKNGRIVEGVRRITICETLEEALQHEAYHQNLSDHYKKPDSRKHYMKYVWSQITNYLKK